MTSYRILVVDDQPVQTKMYFENLFFGDDSFSFVQTGMPSDFRSADISGYDAILLDVNLDEWGIVLSEALAIVGDRCLVVLVSRFWDKEFTHRRISEALAGARNVKFIATLVLNNLGGSGWESYAESMRGQLRLAIEKERRRALLDMGDSDPIRILHLSDPQYGDPNGDDWAAYVEDEIGNLVLRELDQEIHFIAITGDISFSGEPLQLREAEIKLTGLFKHFFPNRTDWQERILLVPGNHDVNLRLAVADRAEIKITDGKLISHCDKSDPSQETLLARFALSPFREFALRLTGDAHWRDAEELCWINDSFRHLGLRFFLLNSAATINCNHPQNAGFSFCALDNLGSGDMAKDQPFGIAFSHHGPPEKTDTGVDVLSEWPKSSKFLKTRGVRLFVHGHGHARKVDRFNLAKQSTQECKGTLSAGEVLRVMAPTTHLNNKKRPENERRGINIITLQRSHGKVEKVEVDSYEFSDDKPVRAANSPRGCRV